MIAMRQLLARIPQSLLLVPVTLVTQATAKPVATVSCLLSLKNSLNPLGRKTVWIACLVNLTFSSL